MKTQNSKIFRLALALAALALNLSAIQQVDGAGFVSVSPMNRARNFFTATLLPNGKVLVAGGFALGISAELYDPATDTSQEGVQAGGSGSPSASTELYDPATGTWTLTGPMKYARSGPTATLLPNGKVLVAGGDQGNTSELYDSTSRTWTATGSGSTDHRTATLLLTGKVLTTGYDGAELYDPATGIWTTTGAPSRGYNTATLLLNGKVLLAGGGRAFTAELYDPDRGTWSATGSLTWDRDYCTATLLRNGQVLMAGGYQQETDTPMASGELYDPGTRTWTETPMNEPHFSHTATLLANGKALIAGGNGWNVSLLSSAELYEPDSDGAAPSMTILYHANQILSFSWTGVGTLEQTESLTAPNWQPAPIQDDPHVITTTEPMKFFRVKAE